PEPERNAELLVHVLDAEVRDVVRHIADGSQGGRVDRVRLGHPLLDEDAGADDTGEPCGGGPAGVKGGAKDIVRGWAIEAVRDVVLTRAHNLHGRADGLRRHGRVDDAVERWAPGGTTAERRRRDADPLGREALAPRR